MVPVRGRDPSPNTPRYPSESASGTPTNAPQTTPYDNGNVIVIGGGVKLGGSRPASAAPHSRRPGDRDRSPSISIASRALSSVMSNGSRKTRSRRRIMPSYLGHLDQPGVGGPVHGPFAAAPPVAPGAQPAPMPWNLLPGQPAQMLPVAQMLMADPKMQAGVQSAIRAATQLLRQPGQPLQKFGQKGGSLVVNTPAGPMWIPADPFLNSAWSGAAAPASGSAPAPASAPHSHRHKHKGKLLHRLSECRPAIPFRSSRLALPSSVQPLLWLHSASTDILARDSLFGSSSRVGGNPLSSRFDFDFDLSVNL